MHAITVYCASSAWLEPDFHEPAAQLGKAIAQRGLALVYGGGSCGLMGEVARACKDNGGGVVGIITERLRDAELAWDGCDELIIVETMRRRKELLAARGDGFMILPGGVGTYEEFFEILVGRLLGEHAKPIGIVNARGYYNPLIAMIEHGIEHRFIKPAIHELFAMGPDSVEVLDELLATPFHRIDDQRLLPTGDEHG